MFVELNLENYLQLMLQLIFKKYLLQSIAQQSAVVLSTLTEISFSNYLIENILEFCKSNTNSKRMNHP